MKEGSQKQMLTCWKLVQASEMVERVQWQGIRSSSSQRGHAPEWQGSGQGCSQDPRALARQRARRTAIVRLCRLRQRHSSAFDSTQEVQLLKRKMGCERQVMRCLISEA